MQRAEITMKKTISRLLLLCLATAVTGLASCHTTPPQAAAESQDHAQPKPKPGTP